MTTTAKKKAAPKCRKAAGTSPPPPTPADWPEWAEKAYRLHARGQRNISELARLFKIEWRTCREWIHKVGAFMADQELQAQEAAEAEYCAGLEEILGACWTTYSTADNDSAKTGCLRTALDALEKIAAARGVVTKREGKEHAGAGGGPVAIHHECDHLSDKELAALLLATSDDGEATGAGED